ncbi:hypothetical protein C9374_005815 [Naegleria lovaniensis]|uniref:Uncharacterized protein n=1 Tax=Naegleria lovaniensis TaxID=51637 RepID=A0AA88KJM7_NAELO|nr:uncharacterized protein C9374_005815 [Naegleria lovaniensis]KAG2382023.1 hypothetical protein C9374_005815 [Naegleria lovaniensis]
MSSPTSALGPSAQQSANVTISSSLKLTPFLKIFLTLMYWEPFVFEMFFGCIAMIWPNSRFMLGCLMPQHLVELLLVEVPIMTSQPPPTTNFADMTLTTNNDMRNLVFFFIRLTGLLLFAFGCLHHLILRHCYKEMSFSNLAYMVERVPLFHWTMLGLCICNMLDIGLSWNFILKDTLIPGLMAVEGDVLGVKVKVWPNLQVVVFTLVSFIICAMRIGFLYAYSGKAFGIGSRLVMERPQQEQHIRRVHVE